MLLDVNFKTAPRFDLTETIALITAFELLNFVTGFWPHLKLIVANVLNMFTGISNTITVRGAIFTVLGLGGD